jgi:hypothetical protein
MKPHHTQEKMFLNQYFFSSKINFNLLNKYVLSFIILLKSINIVFISYLVAINI